MTACEFDGTERVIVDQEIGWVHWRCPFCGAVGEEVVENWGSDG